MAAAAVTGDEIAAAQAALARSSRSVTPTAEVAVPGPAQLRDQIARDAVRVVPLTGSGRKA